LLLVAEGVEFVRLGWQIQLLFLSVFFWRISGEDTRKSGQRSHVLVGSMDFVVEIGGGFAFYIYGQEVISDAGRKKV